MALRHRHMDNMCVLLCGDARKRNRRSPPQGRRQANRPTGPRQLLFLSLPLSHARLHPHRDNAPTGCALGNHWKLSTTPARKATNKSQELACVPLKGPNRNDVPARKPQARHNSLARTYRNRSGKATKRPSAQSPTHTHRHGTAPARRGVPHAPRWEPDAATTTTKRERTIALGASRLPEAPNSHAPIRGRLAPACTTPHTRAMPS